MGEIAYRAFVYPVVAAVAVAGLVSGHWLESSGLLHGLLERGGTAAGVPEDVFQEGPGAPPPEAEPAPASDTQQEQDAGTTDTTSPSPDEGATSPAETVEETTSPTETSPTEVESPTEEPSPAPTSG